MPPTGPAAASKLSSNTMGLKFMQRGQPAKEPVAAEPAATVLRSPTNAQQATVVREDRVPLPHGCGGGRRSFLKYNTDVEKLYAEKTASHAKEERRAMLEKKRQKLGRSGKTGDGDVEMPDAAAMDVDVDDDAMAKAMPSGKFKKPKSAKKDSKSKRDDRSDDVEMVEAAGDKGSPSGKTKKAKKSGKGSKSGKSKRDEDGGDAGKKKKKEA